VITVDEAQEVGLFGPETVSAELRRVSAMCWCSRMTAGS
jgi:hypothetical protein